MNLTPYRWPQGRVLRYLAAGVLLSYIGFAAYRFSVWQSASPFLPFGISDALPGSLAGILSPSVVGAALLLIAGVAAAYFVVFVNARMGDYLIAVEGEMRKVYWPQIKPWFSWSSELWASTYVVIILTVVLAAFIYFLDLVLTPLANTIFRMS